MRHRAMWLLCAWVLAGCAPATGYRWSATNDQTDQQIATDKYECAKSAVDPLRVGGYQEHVYILCMESKGYRRLITVY